MLEAEALEEERPAQPTSQPLRLGAARAALGSGMVEIITRVLAVVLSIATARALEPREVGLLGIAVIIMGVVSMLGFYPEIAAVAARGQGDHTQFAAAASALRAFVLAVSLIILVFTLPLLAAVLTGNSEGVGHLRALLSVLIWVPVTELLRGYPQVILQRRLDLTYLAWMGLAQPLLFVGLAVCLLLKGYGYMGVAWANLAGSGVAAVLTWHRLWWRGWWRLEGWPSLIVFRNMLSGSVKVFIGGFGGYLGERADNLLVAGVIGPAAMSFYSLAWNASRTPANVFARAIGFVLIPTFSRIQDEPGRVRQVLEGCLRHSYLLLAPLCALLFVSAPLLVTYTIGAKWLPLVPCLRVMCVSVLAVPLLHACNALLVSVGRAHLTGIATAVHLITLGVVIPLFTSRWGVLGAAFGDLTAMAILTMTLCTTTRLSVRQISIGFFSTFTLPIVAASLAAVSAWSLSVYLPGGMMRMAGEASLVVTVYLILILLLGGRSRLFDLAGLLRGAARRTILPAESHT